MKTQRDKNRDLLLSKIEQFPYFIIKYFEAGLTTGKSPTTLLSYASDYEEFLNWLIQEGYSNSKTLRDVHNSTFNNLISADITDFKSYLVMQNSEIENTTMNRKISALKSLFKFLYTNDERETRKPYLTKDIMSTIPLAKVDNSPIQRAQNFQGQILVDDEINLFIEFISQSYGEIGLSTRMLNKWNENKERDTAIVSLLLGTGIRVGEIEGLRISDVDLVSKTIHILRKGGKKQTLNYSDRVHHDLINYLNIREGRYSAPSDSKDPNFALFVTKYNKEASPMTKRAIQKMIEKYSTAFGKHLSVHKLRHSFATKFMKKNNNLTMLQYILGHSSIQTTTMYEHVDMQDVKDAMNAIND